jgi:membrane-associated phospholipid phosphatase
MKFKKSIFFVGVVCFVFVLFFAYYVTRTSSHVVLPTYFSYSKADKKLLASLHSNQKITVEGLKKWDKVMLELVKENKLGDAPASRVYAYVYTAQRDAAFLSMNIKHSFMGSIDLVSAKTLCLFFKNNCSDLMSQVKSVTDPFSNELADVVVTKLKARIQNDEKNTHLYPEKSSAHSWAGTHPYFGQEVGSWMPWLMQSVDQFVAPPPPAYDSPEWQHQLKMTQDALAKVTPQQTKAIVFWAGNPGTVTPPGLWLIYANDYIFSHELPLSKILMIRSVLAMGMADSVIAVFNSKYTYWMKRPFMLDPSISTVMPTPNHPSYPAGHSTISSAAATILTYYFPENQANWLQKANEASMGRVWGGIHFTIDAEQGIILGKRVGEAAIRNE